MPNSTVKRLNCHKKVNSNEIFGSKKLNYNPNSKNQAKRTIRYDCDNDVITQQNS